MAARGLGKGLDKMIPDIIGETKEKKQRAEVKENSAETSVAITKVEPNRKQPRKFHQAIWSAAAYSGPGQERPL